MKKVIIATLFLLATTLPVWAQNPTCPTRPATDSSNSCASTAFVHSVLPGQIPLTQSHIFVGDASNLATDYGSLATFSTNGTLTFAPTANTYTQVLNSTQSSPTSGSTAGPLSYNYFTINNQANVTGAAGSSQVAGLRLDMFTGGANLAGNGPIIGLYGTVQNTIAGATPVIDRIGVNGSCVFTVADSSGSGCYGLNSYAGLSASGSINRLVGNESDVYMATGTSANYRYAFSAVNQGDIAATTGDAAIFFGNIGAVGGSFTNMFLLSTSLGQAPISTTGNLFKADAAMTVGSVFNMSNVTVTDYIWNFPNTTMDGAGHMAATAVFTNTLNDQANAHNMISRSGTTTSIGSGSTVQVTDAGAVTMTALSAQGAVCNSAAGLLSTSATGCTGVVQSVATGGTGNTGGAWTTFTPTLTCGTATFTVNSASYQTIGKVTNIQIDYTITAIGTCTTPTTFTLPNTAAVGGAINGQENVNSSSSTSCLVAAASTTATCRRHGNVAAAVNDRYVLSGVYQNQ